MKKGEGMIRRKRASGVRIRSDGRGGSVGKEAVGGRRPGVEREDCPGADGRGEGGGEQGGKERGGGRLRREGPRKAQMGARRSMRREGTSVAHLRVRAQGWGRRRTVKRTDGQSHPHAEAS